jgi:hypothetical protein
MFFVTEWVIERKGISDIEKLYDAAADLDCILWVTGGDVKVGFNSVKFIIQVPSPAIFELFRKNIDHLIFKDWYPVELAQSEILPFEKPVRISEWSGHNQSTFIGGFLEAAAENEMYMKRKNKT